MRQLFDRELEAQGVEPDGYGAMSLIGARSGMRLTELAEDLGMPLTTASDVVRRLEARGVVRRRPNPEDGRSFLFELTTKGDAEWKRGWPALSRIDEVLAQTIDREEMRQALTDLNLAFEKALIDL